MILLLIQYRRLKLQILERIYLLIPIECLADILFAVLDDVQRCLLDYKKKTYWEVEVVLEHLEVGLVLLALVGALGLRVVAAHFVFKEMSWFQW